MKHIVFVEIDVNDIDRKDMEYFEGEEFNSVNDIYDAFDPNKDKHVLLCGIDEHVQCLNDEEYPTDSWVTFVYLNDSAEYEYRINFCDTRE